MYLEITLFRNLLRTKGFNVIKSMKNNLGISMSEVRWLT